MAQDTQETTTISHVIDAINAAFVDAHKAMERPMGPDHYKMGAQVLQAATASLAVLLEHSDKLRPEDFSRIFGYKPSR